jgi:hypothetical protein
MEDKLFDQIIKGKLEKVEAPYQAATWQQLADKLDIAEFKPETDTRLDQLAKEHLSAARHGQMPKAHWEQFANRLDQSHILIQRLRTAKVAELAILILTLLNLDAFAPEKMQWQQPTIKQEVATKSETAPSTPQPATQTSAASPLENQVAPKQKQESVKPGTQSKAAHTRTRVQRAGGRTRPQPIAAVPQAETPSSGSLLEALASVFSSDSEQKQGNSANEQVSQDVVKVLVNQEVVETLPTLAVSTLPHINEDLAFAKPLVKPSANRTKWQLIAHAGPDFIQVRGENRVTTRSYAAGIHAAMRKGKWGLETGVDYANLPYKTKPKKEILAGNPATGQVGRVLRAMDFDLVSVPVRVSRVIFKHKRTEVIAMAGPQVIATATIAPDYDSFYVPGSQPDPVPAPPIPRVPPVASARGLFEGGAVKDNVHLAVQAAVRVEHRLGASNKSFFVEANAQSLLTSNKLGPADDTFSGIGLRTGLIAML